MIAKWSGTCAKCETRWAAGDQIKPWFKPTGVVDGRMTFVRVPRAYVHAPKCPKVTPNRPGQKPPPGVDPTTGEILMGDSTGSRQAHLWEVM